MTKKFMVLISAMVLGYAVQAQKINVVESSERLQGKNSGGHSVELDGAAQEVTAALTRFLKTVGKTKTETTWTVVTDASINGNTFKGPIYATVKGKDKTAVAWMGIHSADWSDSGADSVNAELSKLAYDFGVVYYRDKIQAQIDESNQALQAVQRQQQRTVSQDKDFHTKMDFNERQKIQLEKQTEANKLEHAVLLTHIAENKSAQDSLTRSAEKIKQVIEMQKAKQQAVK